MYIHVQLCMYIDCKYIYGCVPNTMNLISKYCALKIIINCFHTSHFISNLEIQYVRLKLLYWILAIYTLILCVCVCMCVCVCVCVCNLQVYNLVHQVVLGWTAEVIEFAMKEIKVFIRNSIVSWDIGTNGWIGSIKGYDNTVTN